MRTRRIHPRSPARRSRIALLTTLLGGLALALLVAVTVHPDLPGSLPVSDQPVDHASPDSVSPYSDSATSAPPASTRAASAPVKIEKAAATVGGCARRVSRKPVTTISRLTLPKPAVSYGGEGDTERLPLAITARPGGSWLAWSGTDGRVNISKLNCQDKLVGTPIRTTGIDLQDVKADRGGVVVLLTRKGSCTGSPLCGGASSPCNTMHMVRFNNDGTQVWDRQVTNLTGSRGGYTDGARFVWWYQHHGRLAFDGKNYAAYFSVAITVKNGNCVDVHEGDRMQVISLAGRKLSGHDSFEVGCSHSWTTRITWDPRTKHFAMVCATDNECRIAQPNPYRTVATGACDGTLFGGDLVLSGKKGYWTAWSQGNRIRLTQFGTGKAVRSITTANRSAHPHLVAYGPGRMLMAWESGSGMRAQVYSTGTGKAVGTGVGIAARDHSYQAVKDYPDGSAAYPALGSSGTSVVIARVLPMSS